ncbi:hypothetical protein BASA83_005776 [Batrachochytrium salamandrivorans]|nr:hypothetical protein BASA62_010262 [Batrachochytrium salamandrivorans]KAH9271938.1 hypothetical protein BASA83_005776 [Batrachochytrium salamandrivorans]
MKLIPFALISLVTTTVRAYPPQTDDNQKINQSRDETTLDPQTLRTDTFQDTGNPSQNRIQDKLNKLRLSHEDLEDYISKLKETITSLRQRQSTLESEMKQLRDMLSKKYIKEESKLELRAIYTSLFGTWNQVRTTEKSQKADLQEVEKERDSTEIKLKTLEQNQKRRMEHNVKHQNQLELSPNSDYSKDILKQQLGEACLKAKDLVMAKKNTVQITGEVYRLVSEAGNSCEQGLKEGRGDLFSCYQKFSKIEKLAQQECDYLKTLYDSLSF